MGRETPSPGSSAISGRNAQRSLKAYHAPQYKILTAEQAEVELRTKALPGDASAQQLLKIATELAKRSHGVSPMLPVEPKASIPD